jgi:RHS repeat-associated protein
MKKICACLVKILSLSLLIALPLAVQASANNFTYYVNDAVGSPVVAMNQAGDVIWRKIYQPYGKASGKDGDNRIGYTGHVEDKPDLVYAGARYYDPDLMRFLSDDPARFTEKNSMSFNRYAYANNNPYRFVDPDGRDPIVSGFSYSSGYLPHYGSDQETVDKMTTGINLVAVALAIPAVGAVAFPAETAAIARVTGNLVERLGSKELKTAVEQVNKGNLDRSILSPEQRKIAADFFREKAGEMRGKFAKEAAEFNQHRADFIEGLTDKIPGQLGRK